MVYMCKHNCFLWTVRNDFSRKKTLLKDGKNLREMFSSNFITAAGKQHRGIEVSDEDKHLRWSHDF